MDDLIKLLPPNYTFCRMDYRGNFIEPEFGTSFIDVSVEKAKAAKLLYDVISDGRAEGKLDIVLNDEITRYYIRLLKKEEEIWGIFKKLYKIEPSFKTDFKGNVIDAKDEWEWLVGKNLFDAIEEEKFFRLISKAIEKGEHEEKAMINDRRVVIKVRVVDYLEFYIRDDIESLLSEIASSKDEKEIIEKVEKYLQTLSYDSYEIKIGEKLIERGAASGEEIFFEIENGYLKVYGKRKSGLELLPVAISLAIQSIKKPSFIVNNLPMCAIDSNGNIMYANEKFKELTGYGEEIIGKNIEEISPEHKENKKLKRWRGKNKELWLKENEIKAGEMTYIILDDLTEEKEKIDEGEFLNSILRHDIFNKNQIALGYVGLLEKTNIGKKQKEYIERIKKSIEESNRLIQSVRNLQEIKKERKLKKMAIGRIIKDVCSSFEEEAKKAGMEIICNVSNATVVADNLVREVFSNIIKNAIEHSGGSKIEIYTRDEDDYYKVVIEDNGKGIPEKFLDKIFDEGWKHESKGSGLGLYIVKKLMSRYGGKAKVENKDKGAVFVLAFRKAKREKDFLKIRL